MRKYFVLTCLIGAAALGGCLNWQGSYDQAARFQCDDLIDPDERLACFKSVADNSWQKRRDARSDQHAPEDTPKVEDAS